MIRYLPCFVLGLALVLAPGCKKPAKKTSPATETETVGSTADVNPNTPPAPTGNRGNTTFTPGAGAVQNVRAAAVRTVAINEVKNLGIFIEQKYIEDGKMPGKDDILAYIERDARKIHKAITDGDIILTGTRDHSGLWAYEIDADKRGGIVLVAGTASRASADEVKQLMGK